MCKVDCLQKQNEPFQNLVIICIPIIIWVKIPGLISALKGVSKAASMVLFLLEWLGHKDYS